MDRHESDFHVEQGGSILRGTLKILLTLCVGLGLVVMSAPAQAATGASNVGPASVYPCASWIPGSWANYSIANCEGNSGSFRAVAYCTAGVGTVLRYGRWVYEPSSSFSYAHCEGWEQIYDHAYQAVS